MLSSEDMQRDLDLLYTSWTQLHPGLYRYNTPAEIDSHFALVRAGCRQPLAEKVFYLQLSRLAEKIKCGHTYLNPLNLDKVTRARLLPSRVIPVFFDVVEGKKLVVTGHVSDQPALKTGDEILSINGVSTGRMIDSLLTVSRSDGRNALGKKLHNIGERVADADQYSLFDIYFPLFFPGDTLAFRLVVRPYGSRRTGAVVVKAMTMKERLAAYTERFGPLPADERTWDYRIVSPRTAYMKFGTFAFWNSPFKPRRWVDSVFADLRQHPGVQHLIIDIRGNEGGDNTGEHILSYLTPEPIGCEEPDRICYRYLTIPDSLSPHLNTWDNTFKKPKDPAQFTRNELGLFERNTNGTHCIPIRPRTDGFRGKVYLLIDASNSSAGFLMAQRFRSARLGTLIGETTGGTQQGINGGQFFFLTLPHSRFEIDLPLIYYYHPGKPDGGIPPHHSVPTTQQDLHRGRDAQLEFAHKLIEKTRR